MADRENRFALEAGIRLECFVNRYDKAEPLESCAVEWQVTEGKASTSAGDEWRVTTTQKGAADSEEGLALTVSFRSLNHSDSSAVAVAFPFDRWSQRNYVLVPGAVYGGNRFAVRELSYAPCWSRLADHGPEAPTLITDIPRLALEGGQPSAFHLLSGDAATPAIGVWEESAGCGWLFVTEQATALGDSSLHVEEGADFRTARLSFQAPGVRPRLKYEMATTKVPSPDRGHDFEPGEAVELHCRIYRFPCRSVAGLFARFAAVRRQGEPLAELAASLPLSAAWRIQEDKYNALNWNGQLGYYAVGTIDMKHQDWQIGWVGGGMSSLALLLEGGTLSRERALATMDFIFSSQTEAGFFHGVCYKGQWYGDEFNDDPNRLHPERWHILRKSADALYFLLKHLLVLEKRHPQYTIPERWLEGTRRLADAFVRLWSRYGQFGQWVHTGTGELLVGGSAGAAMAAAGLALCGAYFGKETYNAVAREAGEYYFREFTARGITTGGPGEILQCPDSESAFALLESYIVLYETSGERVWLERAEEAAAQAMSWCVSYNFRFPEDSAFAKLGMQTTGSVIANAQNKHSAPGICTLSGDALLKLYRATGKELYLELLRQIAGNLPQYLSREDRPVRGWDGVDMPAGYMSERVNMSDWEGKAYVGEAIPYSCWCEVSLMLTYAELPGIYVNVDTGKLAVIDQAVCRLEAEADGSGVLTICNPSGYPASVKLLAESNAAAARPLGVGSSSGWLRIDLAPGETARITL